MKVKGMTTNLLDAIVERVEDEPNAGFWCQNPMGEELARVRSVGFDEGSGTVWLTLQNFRGELAVKRADRVRVVRG